MNETVIESPFRLSTGGLFYRLMRRLRLVEANRYLPWRRITLFIALTWLPLLILTAVDGTLTGSGVNITFIRDTVPHARAIFLHCPFWFSLTGSSIRVLQLSYSIFKFPILYPKMPNPSMANYSSNLFADGTRHGSMWFCLAWHLAWFGY